MKGKLQKRRVKFDTRRYWNPRYEDFEFYRGEFGYAVHYIVEKDRVYAVSIDESAFRTMMRGVNLNPNPFGRCNSDMTPKFVWRMIAAYCRTYGSVMTIEDARELVLNSIIRPGFSVRIGHVPVIVKPA